MNAPEFPKTIHKTQADYRKITRQPQLNCLLSKHEKHPRIRPTRYRAISAQIDRNPEGLVRADEARIFT
ncbi:Uncharacterised protein [Bordetella pertussis]|nr:Uncharacterised protein [Bordetella pertussis]